MIEIINAQPTIPSLNSDSPAKIPNSNKAIKKITSRIDTLGKNYKAVLSEKKKFVFEEISGKEAKSKPYKVLSKKILAKGNVQLNLMYGKNIISKEKVNIGDSMILDFENKIVKIIPLKKGSNAIVIEGKHAGNKGQIEEVIERGGKKLVKIKNKTDKINVWIKNIIAVE